MDVTVNEEIVSVEINDEIVELFIFDYLVQNITGAAKLEIDFDKDDVLAGEILVGAVTAKRIYMVSLVIDTAFDGSTTISVGTDAAQGQLMVLADNDPTEVNLYRTQPEVEYAVLTSLKGFFTGTPTVGNGTIIIYNI